MEVRAGDGQRLAVRLLGRGAPLLCVAGGPGRAASYLDDLGGLDEHRTLVLPDPRGSGGSRPADPASLTVERLAEDLGDVQDSVGADALLAHSFGCRVAAGFVAGGGAARALVLLTPPPVDAATAPFPARRHILAARSADPDYAEAIEAAAALPDCRPRERGLLEQLTVPLWYGTWDDTARRHAARAAQETPARTSMTLRQAARGAAPLDLGTLRVPVLVVAGELDFLCPPAAVRAVHDRLPDSTYVEIAGAGHYPWLDAPELLTEVIVGFLDDHGGPRLG